MKKIAIYGGSFNPPHFGHAMIVESILRLFPCDEIWLMPSGERLDKQINVSGNHRLQMLKLMRSELFNSSEIPIKINSLELNRLKLTTTYETKLVLKKKYPNHRFYFIIGSDLIADIKNKWVNGKKLYNSTYFVIIHKANHIRINQLPKHSILLKTNLILTNVSSTLIRAFIRKGYSGIPYITKGVANYIKKHKLYTKKY